MNKPQLYNQTEIDFLRSLNDSDLEKLLGELPRVEAATILRQLTEERDSHSEDMERKRDKRSKAAEVFIRPVVDPVRRLQCLEDPVLFLNTYFPKVFYNPFAEHHLGMIDAITSRAKSGGDKAVAAPRGDGKTQVAVHMMVYVILTGYVQFPIIIASTRQHAQKLFKQIKYIFAHNELIAEDFPEICDCVRALDGAPARANKQHIGGESTRIIWTQNEIGFPHVPGSIYGGRYLTYYGLDSAIRGVHFNGVRPDFALIDDPETREVAFSDTQHLNIEGMIDSDIAGLAGPDRRMTRVILTTVQNTRCYSCRVTDPATKPTFDGRRYGMLSRWPDNRELWDEYIAKRQQSQQSGDKDGWAATEFYLENREAMDVGAVVSNPHRFTKTLDELERPIEVSAIQAFFNRIADWGLARVLAELQNDPEPEETEETSGLTAGLVQTRISGLDQNELPPEDCKITVGLDIGKYHSHWTKTAWFGNATGVVIDYGVLENPGMLSSTDPKAVEISLLGALMQWRTDIFAVNPPDFAFVDAGDYSDAIYEFVRRSPQMNIAASKGWDQSRFHLGKDSADRRTFVEAYASLQPQERIWLYNVNTEFWKGWVHERFITPAFDDQQQRNDGSLSLFSSVDKRRHLSFAHHIVAEERRELFVPGKGLARKWVKVNKNNHWLDSTALAAAASGVVGIRLVPRVTLPQSQPQSSSQQPRQPSRRPNFRHREGGWLKGMRR